jgi:hypothetical protein
MLTLSEENESHATPGRCSILRAFLARRLAALAAKISLIAPLVFVAATATAADREKAARGMGYANGVLQSHKCKDSEQMALNLRNDIMKFFAFTAADLEGTTEIGRSVSKGRANALKDARHPAEFCDRLEETLSLWRSEVLPSPR